MILKYLQYFYLSLQVWMTRRRMRKMGFREAAERTSPEILVRLEKVTPPTGSPFDRLKIALLVIGILIEVLSYWHHRAEIRQADFPMKVGIFIGQSSNRSIA